MNRLVFFVLLGTAMIFPSIANAVGDVTSTVVTVRIDRDGKGYVSFPINTTTPASCVTTWTNVLSFDTNTAAGKAVEALVTAAFLSGSVIEAHGTGLCNEYRVMEGLNNAVIHHP